MLRKICILITALIGGFSIKSMSHGFSARSINERLILQADTIEEEELTEADLKKFESLRKVKHSIDTVEINRAKLKPYTNIADFLKGQLAGVYVQQPTAESGTLQNVIVRGAGIPLFETQALNNARPTVFVNGIPMTTNHSFAYNSQPYKFNRLGPETDFYNFVDISAIESIEVVKDPARLATLGPLAANGAILITTFGGISGAREISVNSYFGINRKPAVTPVNAHYENLFRQPFYALYNNTAEARQVYPGFLADSTNLNYYGPSKWQDAYYRNASLYSIDMSLRGGTDRANFGFLAGTTKNSSTADNNNFDRYNALLNINMLPFSWFTVSAYINGTRTERDRNRNLRDRYSEMGYLPDLSTPLSPNLGLYQNYLGNYKRSVDDNITNSLQGNLSLSFDILNNLKYTSTFMVDYSEGIRDVFYPTELMETINYISNYYGYSQRYAFTNRVSYAYDINEKNRLSFNGGVEYMDDLYRFGYAKAFDGPNDFIKLNVVNGKTDAADYLVAQGGLKVYRWYNTEYNRLFSVYGRFGYDFNSILAVNGVLRWDGSSAVQPDHRWLFTPSASVKWNINKQLEQDNEFSLQVSAGRLGRIQMDSRLGVGPQYSPNMNWSNESSIMSYYGNAGLSRPYNRGWVGYDMGWAYVDQMDLTILKSFYNNRLTAGLSVYQKEDKNQVALVPVPEEYGYVGEFKNGLAIRNRGLDLTLKAKIFDNMESFQWSTGLNLNLNKSEVTALPNGLKELAVGNRLLRVGESADAFWVLENVGRYDSEAEVPVSDEEKFSNDGIAFGYGDPKWKDQNGDFRINEDDKVLKGNALPKVFGGFNNRFAYKNFDLNVDLVFALGHKVLNDRAATKYNFINNESNNSISSVREIFHWQQDVDIAKYPLYNVWSGVDPYRVDQDLFLEDASYLKVRGVSLGYSLTNASFLHGVKTLRKAYIYATVNNLYTFTKFSGRDPELVNINGYYDGYGLPQTPTYTIGFKLDL
ncbi:TonB-linked outer membrane protein, SusC/RagA family [Sphingobacterium nematocida]|uniref:TonB-linked outer membrane protein, SusC/RagA family n=1 Tax=Sphingobacterium nematocida TaxID=1513896 RepID=A0A1T5GHB4_9SPHI|nr:SusC/RagA family TonB-linked outer membrane protein [Sphingobacterium nematocida]SKC07707.1 TonB-linked outer membrane protein, SusC/RagA family [Sphingobacterium nematocida]